MRARLPCSQMSIIDSSMICSLAAAQPVSSASDTSERVRIMGILRVGGAEHTPRACFAAAFAADPSARRRLAVATLHLLGSDVFDVGGDRPLQAERVANRAGAVAVELVLQLSLHLGASGH